MVVNAFPFKLFKKNEPPAGLSRTDTFMRTDEAETAGSAFANGAFTNGVAVNSRENSGELMTEAFKTKELIPGLDIANGVLDALEIE